MKNFDLINKIIVGRVEPHIYAFTTNTVPNYLKIGDTYRPVTTRLREWRSHYPNLKKEYEYTAKLDENVFFRDYSVHYYLENDLNKKRLSKEDLNNEIYYSNEFFKNTSSTDIKLAIEDISKVYIEKGSKYTFYDAETSLPAVSQYESTNYWKPRPNQQRTIMAFKKAVKAGRTNLLMYAVMRFGKSFTSMCCAKEMNDGEGARFVIVVSAKADVKEEWKKTVQSAENFRNDYCFLTSIDLEKNYNIVNQILNESKTKKNVVLFLTLQDLQGDDIKKKHSDIFNHFIDLLIIDETHFGARAEKYGQILRHSQFKDEKSNILDNDDFVDFEEANEEIKKVFDAKVRLHLSGTPYRILMGNEFQKEDIIAFYQFSDIVQEKEDWDRKHLLKDEIKEWDNPYFGFPQMIRFALNPNKSSIKKMEQLRESGLTYTHSALFKTKSLKKMRDGSHKEFIHEKEILDLLKVIDGSKVDDNLLGFLNYEKIKSGMMCRHIVCVLPYRASCDALESMIKKYSSRFKNLKDYKIINISGVDNPHVYKNTKVVIDTIKRFENSGFKTITLTVNRMLTGSTVEEWDTMLYFKDTSSPQEYDQAIFRLQNQFIKTFQNKNGEEIKYNMKPQTILVDFNPIRMFQMQEQKSQFYNVNIDVSGNTKLSERLKEELRISPIIVVNQGRFEQVNSTDILKAISEYSRNRGVLEETNEIPVDLSLIEIPEIWNTISLQNELDSGAGFSTRVIDGQGKDIDVPEPDSNINDKVSKDTSRNTRSDNEQNLNPSKQFRMYYARILYFSFLTKDKVFSLQNILDSLKKAENKRILRNLGLDKQVLSSLNKNMDKFMLSTLDYKIQNLNQLSHDASLNPMERATVANQKFGKIGESEVVTPSKTCDDMIGMVSNEFLMECVKSGRKILDVASKEGEFAISVSKRYIEMGVELSKYRDIIYSIPTSTVTYEFTRKIYEILGLNIKNISEKFNSYDLLNVKDNESEKISIEEIVEGGSKEVKFGAIVGNPPYHESDGGAQRSARPIYQHFINSAKKLKPDYMTFIIPTRWYAGGKGLDEFRVEMLNDRHIQILHDYLNPKEIFPDINNRGGVCYFLWNKSYDNTKSKVSVITHDSDGSISKAKRNMKTENLDIFLRSNKAVNIFNKVNPVDSSKTMASIVSARKPFGIESNIVKGLDFKTEKKNLKSPIVCYGKGMQKGYIEKDLVSSNHQWIDNWKVCTPRANNIGTELKDDNFNTFISEPNSVCTEAYIVIGGSLNLNKNECINIEKYMKTKFVRFMHSLAKASHDASRKTYRFIPLQDFSSSSQIVWKNSIKDIDIQLYEIYKLTVDEINYINKSIKDMD